MLKGNPFKAMNSMSRMMDVVKQARQAQNDPSMIGKLLLDNGRISKEQYKEIKNMNSPSQIGNYLMNSGVLNQQQINQMYQYVPQVQQAMNQ